MTEMERLELIRRFQRIGAKRHAPGEPHIWNDVWERQKPGFAGTIIRRSDHRWHFRWCLSNLLQRLQTNLLYYRFVKKFCNYKTCSERILKLKYRKECWKA